MKLREIESVLAGNGKRETIQADAKHVAESIKWGGYFITCDDGILKRDGLKALGANVLLPSEFLALVKVNLP